MQDRFRFRVWKKYNCPSYDGHKSEMFYDAEKTYDFTTNEIPENCFNDILENEKEYIVMQCTGLKDKNGKLIYEGDIVLGSWKTKLIVIYDVFSSRFMLKTIKGQATEIAYYTCFDTQGEDIYCKNLEILGNIYENKDLLAKDTTNE